MERIFKKKYTIKLIIKRKILFFSYNKKIILEYGKATLKEYYYFQKILEENKESEINKFLFNFVESFKKGRKNLKKQEYAQILAQKKDIFKVLLETYLKKSKIIPIVWKIDEEYSPIASNIVFLSQKLHISPKELLNYTIDEIDFLTEGIERNINAKTEEWQKRNKMKWIQNKAKNIIKAEKEEIDNFLNS